MELSMAFKLFIALVIGSAIGLEREVHEKNDQSPEAAKFAIVGLRTFALITVLGAVAGLLYANYLGIFLLISITFMVLLLTHYIFTGLMVKDIGITTELAIIFSYLIGVFVGLEVFPIQLTLALTVVLILILANKDKIKGFTEDVEKRELSAFTAYALIALVILPFLPNQPYSLSDIPNFGDIAKSLNLNPGEWSKIEIINPFKLWTIVAIITGVDVVAYILKRIIGDKKGLLLTSIVGGLISSTATTISNAQASKHSHDTNRLVSAAIFATTASFIPTFLIVVPISTDFAGRSFPTFLLLLLTSTLCGAFFYFQKDKKTSEEEKAAKTEPSQQHIFALEPALHFALIYLGVRILTKVALALFGNSGFLVGSALAGFTGIDAATINIADIAGKGIDYQTAILAFIIVNAVNLGAKTFYSYLQGSKEFAFKIGASMLLMTLSAFGGLLFV